MTEIRKKRTIEFFQNQEGICYLCGGQMTLERGKPNTVEREHITPRSVLKARGIRPKMLDDFNTLGAGAACNQFKADKPLSEVISALHRLKLCQYKTWEEVNSAFIQYKKRQL